MDRSSGKRSVGGLVTRTKACISGLKDAVGEEDENAQFCNRIGCRGRIKYGRNMKTGSSDKGLYSSPACSSNKNKLTGMSSMCSSMITCARKPYLDSKRKLSSRLYFDPSESSLSSKSQSLVLISSPCGKQSESMKNSGEVIVRETRNLRISMNALMSSPSSLTEDQLEPMKKSGEVTVRETRRPRISLNVRSSPSSWTRDKSEATKKSGDVTVTEAGRPRVSWSVRMSPPTSRTGNHSESKRKPRDVTTTETVRPRVSLTVDKSSLRHQSTPQSSAVPLLASKSSISARASGVLPPSSSMELESAREKRNSGGEKGPPRRVTKTSTASLYYRKNSSSTRGSSISDSSRSSAAASVSTRGSMNLNVRGRLSSRQNGRSRSADGRSAVRISPSESPENVGNQSSPQHLSGSIFSSGSRLSSPFDSIGNSGRGFTCLMHDEMFLRCNMDRIAEGFLALRRFGQDEEWTDEEALAFYISNLDDQHRDMRLDIDNMSYEELLALEERMGTVSTALSEEALLKCLSRSIYQPEPSDIQITGTGEDGEDIKCSICQEEYVVGDEVGKMADCQHEYHVTCINDWLQLKNWCPICKTSAGPSQSSLSL